MSVFDVPEASPSRIAGVLRFILAEGGDGVLRSKLLRMMAPVFASGVLVKASAGEEDESSATAMVENSLREAIRLKLVEETDQLLRISPTIVGRLNDRSLWPITIFDQICNPDTGNENTCRAFAWLLAQPITQNSGGWAAKQTDEKSMDALGLNVLRYGQLLHWAAYSGFGWTVGREKVRTFVPDPTVHLKLRLRREVFGHARSITAELFFDRIATLCPVLDRGKFRNGLEVEKIIPKLDEVSVSSSLAQAMLRLRDEGWIELRHASDARGFVIQNSEELVRVSEIALLKAEATS